MIVSFSFKIRYIYTNFFRIDNLLNMASFVKKTFFGLLTTSVIMLSCSKKDIPTDSVPANNATGVTKITYNLLDSIFLYAKQLYYWNTSLPTYSSFQPRNYNTSVSGDDLAKGSKEIFDLTRYAINPATGKSYEFYKDSEGDTTTTKYSYMETQDADLNTGTTGFKSNVTLAGWGNDLGIVVTSGSTYANVLYPRIVYNGGPAALQNIKRGQIISKVNGVDVDLTTDAGVDAIKGAFGSSATDVTLTFADTYTEGKKWINTTNYYSIITVTQSHDVKLTKTRYQSNTILKDTTLTVGTNKIGYLALLNFSSQDVIKDDLNNAFSTFNSNGISNIVIDLRYNGGGMVETSEQMANLIAPSSLDGKVMYSEVYNDLMQSGKADMLKNIPQEIDPSKNFFQYSWTVADHTYGFNAAAGKGLNVKNVFFIVSSGTASASELLINNLKPYMNVKIIGTTLTANSSNLPATTTTYGKPVGFFAIPIGKYDVYLSEFESRNSNNTAVSYSGMACDVTDWDDATHDLGDVKEDGLAQAINYINNGQFITTSTNIGAKSVVSNSNFGVTIFMSKTGGAANALKVKSYHPTFGLPVYKGMVENFKSINRNK